MGGDGGASMSSRRSVVMTGMLRLPGGTDDDDEEGSSSDCGCGDEKLDTTHSASVEIAPRRVTASLD